VGNDLALIEVELVFDHVHQLSANLAGQSGPSGTIMSTEDHRRQTLLGASLQLICLCLANPSVGQCVIDADIDHGYEAIAQLGARTMLEAWASNVIAFWQDAGIGAYMTTGAVALAVFVVWFRRRFAIRIVAT
jgi:hypothetical protein